MQLSLLMRGIDPLRITGQPDGEVASVCYDSRQCREGSLFVAIPGLKADGHDFIADALARGARFIVHEGEFHPPAGVTAIRVRDSRRSLGILGKNLFGDPSAGICLIAVVGTNGKTTVTYLLESILRTAGYAVGVLGTVNYRYWRKDAPRAEHDPRILRHAEDPPGDGGFRGHPRRRRGLLARHRPQAGRRLRIRSGNLHQPHPGPPRLPPDDGELLPGKEALLCRGAPRRGERPSAEDDRQRRRPLGATDPRRDRAGIPAQALTYGSKPPATSPLPRFICRSTGSRRRF